jgi:hypothetical protein
MMTPKRLGRELEARLDGPHADEHTAATADLAAEAIRYLNYATGSHAHAGLAYPSTVYDIAGRLGVAADRMPQLFAQLADWLDAEESAGRLGTGNGNSVACTVTAARVHLINAIRAANTLAADLHALQNAISGLNGRGPSREGRAA